MSIEKFKKNYVYKQHNVVHKLSSNLACTENLETLITVLLFYCVIKKFHFLFENLPPQNIVSKLCKYVIFLKQLYSNILALLNINIRVE